MNLRPVLCCVLVLASGAHAGPQASDGGIDGTIVDSLGAALPAVQVSATRTDTGAVWRTASDGRGDYVFPLVPPGDYEIEFALDGFTVVTRRPIRVGVGQRVDIDARLTAAPAGSEVLLTTPAPPIEAGRTHAADTIGRLRIENSPLDGRMVLDLTLLTPGATRARGPAAFELPWTPDSDLSFTGQSGRSHRVAIDGLDIDAATGAAVIGPEGVEEFRVHRAGVPVEVGRARTGVIHLVSRSGGNDWHGSAFVFARHEALDAPNPFAVGPGGAVVDAPFRRVQSGFGLGGPIVRDRSFFFVSYDGRSERRSETATFLQDEAVLRPTASQAELLAVMSSAPVAELRSLGASLSAQLTTSEASHRATVALLEGESGVFPARTEAHAASLRLDHQVPGTGRVSFRLGFGDADHDARAFGGLTGPSGGVDLWRRDVSVNLSAVGEFSASRLNELRFQWADGDLETLPTDALGPEIQIHGLATLGRDAFLPIRRDARRWRLVDNFIQVAGRHELKTGGEWHRVTRRGVSESYFGGRFVFGQDVPLAFLVDSRHGDGRSAAAGRALAALGRTDLAGRFSEPITALQAYNMGRPISYRLGLGDPAVARNDGLLAGYLQDTVRVTRSLTLALGVRYDVEVQTPFPRRDANNVAPRIGFSWSFRPRTVLRGGYGVFHAPVDASVGWLEPLADGAGARHWLVLRDGRPGPESGPDAARVWERLIRQGVVGDRRISAADVAGLGLSPETAPSVRLRPSPDRISPYSQQATLEVEREWGAHWTASVGYLWNRGVKLPRSRNRNLRIVGDNESGPVFGLIDAAILQDNVLESSGNSVHHGVTARVGRRFSDFYQFHAAYTLSKTIDDVAGALTELQAANQLDLASERAVSALDERHRLVLTGVFRAPLDPGFAAVRLLAGITLSPSVILASGRPFNLRLGFDANGDTNPHTDRPPSAGRNTGRGPRFASVDIRVQKSFDLGENRRIDAVAEAFNLFNAINYSGVNTVVGASPMPSFDVTGDPSRGPAEPLGFTGAHPPRRIQLGLRFRF